MYKPGQIQLPESPISSWWTYDTTSKYFFPVISSSPAMINNNKRVTTKYVPFQTQGPECHNSTHHYNDNDSLLSDDSQMRNFWAQNLD